MLLYWVCVGKWFCCRCCCCCCCQDMLVIQSLRFRNDIGSHWQIQMKLELRVVLTVHGHLHSMSRIFRFIYHQAAHDRLKVTAQFENTKHSRHTARFSEPHTHSICCDIAVTEKQQNNIVPTHTSMMEQRKCHHACFNERCVIIFESNHHHQEAGVVWKKETRTTLVVNVWR